MQISFEIPAPRFKPGDVVLRPNKHNDRAIILLITGWYADGAWTACQQGKAKEPAVDGRLAFTGSWSTDLSNLRSFYDTVVQAGSWYDDTASDFTQMRPGKIITFAQVDFDKLATEKLGADGLTICTGDTLENLDERVGAWVPVTEPRPETPVEPAR